LRSIERIFRTTHEDKEEEQHGQMEIHGE
jgi:hypothetical protein